MRAEHRRSTVSSPTGASPSDARLARGSSTGARALHLRLVRFEPPLPVRRERGTVARLLLGFAAIAGFVGVGLWVEFGALERAAYLVSSLGFFSLYGAATWVRDPDSTSRSRRALPPSEDGTSFRSRR